MRRFGLSNGRRGGSLPPGRGASAGTSTPLRLAADATWILGAALLAAGLGLGSVSTARAQPAATSAPTLQDILKQEAGPSAEAPAPEEDLSDEEVLRGTPRRAVQGFLRTARAGDFRGAAEFLDLSRLPKSKRAERGPELARHLKIVLDRTVWINLDALSAEPEGRRHDGLPASQERVATIEGPGGRKTDILLARVRGRHGHRVWKFSAGTVAAIPRLYREFGLGPLGDLLPGFFFDIVFLGVQIWQWVALPLLAVVDFLLAFAATWALVWVLHRRGGGVVAATCAVVSGPLRLILALWLFRLGVDLLGLPIAFKAVLAAIEQILVAIVLTWMAMRVVDFLAATLREHLLRRRETDLLPVLPAGTKAAKALAGVLAGVFMLNVLGFDVTTVLAGLGIGGIAVAFAAQKSVENVIGGLALYLNQPVRIGDFCRFGDRVGTVEEIGLWATRVRTLDRTLVTIPNGSFSNLELENFTRRDKIWYHPTIGLRYETTPDQLRYILVEVRKLLYAHPKVDPESARIRFVNFGAYSLDLEIFAYILVTDYGEYLEVVEDLNLRIMDVVEKAGSSFAFPSQTTYLEQGTPLDPDRVRQAEARVREWRERRELYLPRFPPEKIRELRGTVPYPPEGSPPLEAGGDDAGGGSRRRGGFFWP